MAKGRLFLLLLWKNFIIQKRKVAVTIFQIFVPTIFAVILILFRERVHDTPKPEGMNWTQFSVHQLSEQLVEEFPATPRFAFCPDTVVTNDIMKDVGKHLKLVTNGTGFSLESDMVKFLMFTNSSVNNSNTYLGGVVFNNIDTQHGGMLPRNISYKIRLSSIPRNAHESKNLTNFLADTSSWRTDRMFPMFERPGPRNKWDYFGGSNPGYFEEGFLALQHSLNWAIIRHLVPTQAAVSDLDNMSVYLRRHPYPPFNNDAFIIVIQNQFPQIVLLSFILCVLSIVNDVTFEKERRLKESMKMMGLNNWLHWCAWFVKYFIYLLIVVAIMTVLYTADLARYGSVINCTDPSIIFIFLMSYSICLIAYCFLISVFFNKANSATAAAGVIFFILFIPYYFIQPRYDTINKPTKFALSLLFNVAMPFGCQIIGMFEGTGAGVQWSTLAHGASVDETFSLFHVIFMLLFDTLLYLLLMWYIEAVWPGDYGIPLPWYFPIQRSYWCGGSVSDATTEERVPLLDDDHSSLLDSVERDPMGMTAGIKIMKLTKVYKDQGNSKPAVSKLSLNMFEGQITALLGHNGAGKTTTMSMLTGFIPPTSGTAIVNGFNILHDIVSVRHSLGLCPQHDILFDSLTVEEHLKFFALAKGYPRHKLRAEIDHIVTAVGLEDKRFCASKTLSGGMKRKLSIGIALIADSKIVILDEPTSGMDPSTRHYIWSVLQRYRAGRTIVLSTHYMDEADLLGDRIAIMADGEVQCCGSSLFLKNKYGAGYHMVVVKTHNCDVNRVTDLVTSYVPSAKLESNVGLELSYVLPHTSSDRFEELFTEIEQHKHKLGVSSYGASVTTLEEVFLKVGEVTNGSLKENLNRVLENSINTGTAESSGTLSQTGDPNYSTVSLFPNQEARGSAATTPYLMQFYAMFVKRVLHSMRNIILSLTQLAVPVVFTLFALVVIKTFPGPSDSPPLLLQVEKFGHSVVPYSHAPRAGQTTVKLADIYRETVSHGLVRAIDVNHLSSYRDHPNTYNYLYHEGKRDVAKYNKDFMIAANFTDTHDDIVARAFFNNQAYHSIAISLNSLENAVLKLFTNSSFWFETTNHPLPMPKTAQIGSQVNQIIGFSVAFDILFGISFLASSFAFFLIKERAVKAKHIQVVSGVNPFNFWLSTFSWDLINFIMPCILVIIFFFIFQIKAYIIGLHSLQILLLFVLYAWAMLPFIYLASFLFTVPSTGTVWICMFNILTGLFTMVIVTVLKLPFLDTVDVGKTIEWTFLVLLPNFCLGDAIQTFYYNYEFITVCHSMIPNLDKVCKMAAIFNMSVPCCPESCKVNCLDFNYNYLGWSGLGIGRMLLFLSIQGVIFFSLLFLLESGLLQRALYAVRRERSPVIFSHSIPHSSDSRVKTDDDVTAEKHLTCQVVQGRLTHADTVVIDGLTKLYRNLTAVDSLHLTIRKGECFGLLGINGAGKTTTFKMLTGDEILTSGDAFLCGYSIRTHIKQVQKVLGYCPQYDALIDQMTGREMLRMFARLRGVPSNEIRSSVENLISSLLFTEHADKLVKYYSGGNKRKLSTALALIGDPPIVFLDEPSTGMDPVARRLLWNTLSRVRERGHTLVLSSHSMEECEALCTRIAIMVNGQLKCLGSPQHLKSKFGEGYTLLAKVAYPESGGEPDLQPIMSFIEQTFKNSELKDVHEGMVHYHIKNTELSWAAIFGTMERAKVAYKIDDYSVSQTTLEQVFINFARSQRPPMEVTKSLCVRCRLMCCGCCRPPLTLEVVE